MKTRHNRRTLRRRKTHRKGGNPIKKQTKKTAKKYVEASRARRFLVAGAYCR